MQANSPFHAGEIAIQQRLGVAERMAEFGRRVVRDYMPDQHRQFYAHLPFLVLATVDDEGRPWASLLEGEPGFAHSPAPTRLDLAATPAAVDPARAGWRPGSAIGLLGIELPTRRRNRVNGLLRQGSRGLQLEVEHSFGNCPQYIQARGLQFACPPGSQAAGAVSRGEILDEPARAMIAAADTFFVASYVDHADGRRSVDASHRGGKPGFVQVQGNRLSIPDFAGNLHFNTLGNFVLNPRAGLLFVDFGSGDVLQLSGRVVLDLDADEARFFQGAERLWHLQVEQWVLRRGALALRGDAGQMSMNSALTGSWEEADARRQAEQMREQWRSFRITRIDLESAAVKSFWLEPTDGRGLNVFKAGQHLPVRAVLEVGQAPVERSYTLSLAPSDGAYRLSIRRQGRFSRFMHEHVQVGDEIEARAPRGNFSVDALQPRPLVLLSAGIGITPMLALLRHVIYEGMRKRRIRPTWFIHGSRSESDRAFSAEIDRLNESVGGAVRVLQALTEPGPDAREGKDFHFRGRLDLDLLKSVLPFDDFDFYLCGPPAFMQDLYAGLRRLHVPDERIHAESFGPAGLRRDAAAPLPAISSQPVPVSFARSGKEARWSPGSGNLLELAQTRGLNPEHSCRQGLCGSCSHALKSGSVTYAATPASDIAPGQVLLCQALPAEGSGPIVIEA
ncbi:MAG: pyridoxamine 5'-phosphate oxidase family protein [Rhodanobacteraceae bacterium]|nr:pyridoxamine 5'-phosphate oxidase family protein [Rhodanobacteraceae bacterium]